MNGKGCSELDETKRRVSGLYDRACWQLQWRHHLADVHVYVYIYVYLSICIDIELQAGARGRVRSQNIAITETIWSCMSSNTRLC